jgi:hypothetical protein
MMGSKMDRRARLLLMPLNELLLPSRVCRVEAGI